MEGVAISGTVHTVMMMTSTVTVFCSLKTSVQGCHGVIGEHSRTQTELYNFRSVDKV
jgi:hypothetical protein